MSIWERLSAVAQDFSMKSPVAFLLGSQDREKPANSSIAQDNEVPFTVGVIVLSAKMAKVDGSVVADEIEAFKEAFKVSPAEMKRAAPVFNSAKRDAANFEDCADHLVTVFNGNRKLLESVLDGLFHIAKADEEVRPEEQRFLGEIAARFGFTPNEFNAIKARHMVVEKRNPYDVLGVDPSIGNEELERRHRQLVAENDAVELLARGIPKEFVIIAVDNQAALNEAYRTILSARSS